MSVSINKNILINGCSFSRGPKSWPYYLQNANIVNLACSGAGNDYIFNTTISELAHRQYDFVIIMWTQPSRIDVKVDNIDLFSESPYTSLYQSSRNDWAEKVIIPINDQDYVEKDWVFGCGFLNGDPMLDRTKLFDGHYYYQNNYQFVYLTLVKMISLQNFLKHQGTPYLFTYYQDYSADLEKIPHLFNMLDQNNIYNEQNIHTITKDNKWFDADGAHPGPDAHKEWARLISHKIN